MAARQRQQLLVVIIAALIMFGFAPATNALTQSFVPITFPVSGKCTFEDTFGASRSGGTRAHEGIDIIADKMTPEVAVVDGTIDWLNDGIETSTANGLPFFNLLLHGDDGNDYYYIHINNDTPGTDDGKGGPANAYAPGMADKVHVKAGQVIAYVGDSGNAEETTAHLHFEIHQGGYKNPINPYMSLVIAKNGSPYKDVMPDSWYVQYLLNLSSKSIVSGYADDTFRPASFVTKGEFTKMVSLATGLGREAVFCKTFDDVTETCWAWPYINSAKAAGIVDGDLRGNFNSDSFINRAEAAKIAVRACKENESAAGSPFRDIAQDFWACSSITTAKNVGLIDGYVDGNFRPLTSITRAEAAKIVDNIFKQHNR